MSCHSCPCQFNWPIDTQGSKRDPVTSEKAWLDFAVRCLSREAVCRGRGQETVWGAACKPSWWDVEMGIQWKNPTANPKDTKDVLLKKYKALDRHLREEGRFPKELEEESKLFDDGKYKELFLLTSLTSLLGKVTGVHSATLDAATKTENLKAEINQSLLQDINSCLRSTLSAIENLGSKSSSKKVNMKPTMKRSHDSSVSENDYPKSVEKMPKLSSPCLTNSNGLNSENDICQVQTVSTKPTATVAQISAYSKKLIEKHKVLRKCNSPAVPKVSKFKPILPSPKVVPSSPLVASEVNNTQQKPELTTSVTSPIYVNISQEQLDLLSSGQPVPFLNSMVTPSSSPPHTAQPTQSAFLENVDTSPINETISVCQASNVIVQNGLDSFESFTNNNSNENAHDLITDSTFSLFETQNTNSQNHLSSLDLPVNISEQNIPTSFTPSSLGTIYKNTGVETIAPFETNITQENVTSSNTSVHSEFDGSISGRLASSSVVHSSPKTSEDRGYGSDESAIDNIDIDELFTFEEQSQLWEDDGSYLLDRFLTDLDESI